MRSGKSVYRTIKDRVAAARDDLWRAGGELRALQNRAEELRAEEVRTLARLAKVRLGELEGQGVAARLDAADSEALAILADRERERERLQIAVDTGAAALAKLMAEREECLDARDEMAGAFQRQVEATQNRLAGVDSYVTQKSHAEFAAAQADNADSKASQAEEDCDTKRKPYEDDKLFSYLWKRRYRFPDYRAWPLFATLDGWVAGKCGYEQAHRDYGMLLEIPVRLRAHADGLAAAAEKEAQKLAEMERAALAEDGGTPLREAWEAAQAQLDDVEARIVAAEADHDRVCLEQRALAAANDPYSARAAAVIQAQMSSEDVYTLSRDAAATATSSDDDLVLRIAGIRSRRDELGPQIADAERDHKKAQEAFSDLEDLQRRFRRQDFESSRSRFDSDFDIGSLIGSMLSGTIRRGDVWSRMRRHQSWKPSNPFGGGSSSSGGFGGFGGFSSGGSFSSGGGFGGGGGGGGGFSTGGGF